MICKALLRREKVKKFVFELEGILSIKQKLEAQAKMDFGLAQARLNAEQDRQKMLEMKCDEYRDRQREAAAGLIDLAEVNRCRSAIENYEERIEEQKLAVRRAERQVELMRAKLRNAMVERKSIARLREKKFAEYMQEFNADERKQIDELTSYRYTVEEEE